MPPLSRRGFLVFAALIAPLARLRGAGQRAPAASTEEAISVEQFLQLSERLMARSNLDPRLATTYRNALVAVPANIPLLAQLAEGTASTRTAAHVALEGTIIEWWYTGVYTLNGEPRVATHMGALMWGALGMPAPGTCASAFGAWSQPPDR
jgi:hypothetical protein